MKGKLIDIIEHFDSLEWDWDLYVASEELALDSLVAVFEDDGPTSQNTALNQSL